MLDLARDLLPLMREGTPVAAVTVTHVSGSAPRGIGAAMAVTADAAVIGSISGGCVESDAVALALTALSDGRARSARFGFTDADAHAAGLACGGQVDVLAHVVDPTDALTLEALTGAAADRTATVAIIAAGPRAGSTVAVDAVRGALRPSDRALLDDALALRGNCMLRSAYGRADVLVLSHAPRARLIILGAGDHAAALSRVGSASGFSVTVCDPWATLVTAARFPDADLLAVSTPADFLASLDPAELDARTAVCVLTHDERLDVPAIRQALSMPVGFVGAMGARRTVARRAMLLREAGVGDVDLARLHSPLGLDLAGSSPDEVALSVLAEIVASRHGGSGNPLRETAGPLHSRRAACADDPPPQRADCAIDRAGLHEGTRP